jgi:hypothetical protein
VVLFPDIFALLAICATVYQLTALFDPSHTAGGIVLMQIHQYTKDEQMRKYTYDD